MILINNIDLSKNDMEVISVLYRKKTSNNILKQFIDDFKLTVSYGLRDEGHSYKPLGNSVRASQALKCIRYVNLDVYWPYLDQADKDMMIDQVRDSLSGRMGETEPGQAGHERTQLGLFNSMKEKWGPVQVLSMEEKVTTNINYKGIMFSISGHYDLLARHQDNLFVADLKTQANQYWDWLKGNLDEKLPSLQNRMWGLFNYHEDITVEGFLNEFNKTIVKPEHIAQLSIYQYMLGKIPGKIIYMNKKDYTFYVWEQPFIQKIFTYAMDHFAKMIEYRKDLQLPDPLYKDNNLEDFEDNKNNTYPCKQGSYTCKFFYVCHVKRIEEIERRITDEEAISLGVIE